MSSGPRRAARIALLCCLLLWGPTPLPRANPAWAAPPGESSRVAVSDASAPLQARNLAFAYLNLWSAPNRVSLASAPSFYGSRVWFHGRTRPLGSVLAEKRRFAERWPDRTYRYRPETTQVSCETERPRCTVWSIFDFSASNARQGRRSQGIGEHELVVSFADGRPVIASENSRVLRRGAVRRP
jgi:hypothetical protein